MIAEKKEDDKWMKYKFESITKNTKTN
jgi:hypothetical protein